MFYLIIGLVAGVFLPVKYNVMIKDGIFAAINWVRTGPAETKAKGNDGTGE